jgi:hypothetical protein
VKKRNRERRRRMRTTKATRRRIARVMWELTPQSLRYLEEAARGLAQEQGR